MHANRGYVVLEHLQMDSGVAVGQLHFGQRKVIATMYPLLWMQNWIFSSHRSTSLCAVGAWRELTGLSNVPFLSTVITCKGQFEISSMSLFASRGAAWSVLLSETLNSILNNCSIHYKYLHSLISGDKVSVKQTMHKLTVNLQSIYS